LSAGKGRGVVSSFSVYLSCVSSSF